jgi:acetyltransferase-like isoleucine patch superfamily enzyme
MGIYSRNEQGDFQLYTKEIKDRMRENNIVLGDGVVLGDEVKLGDGATLEK